jgi:hypothetical protein
MKTFILSCGLFAFSFFNYSAQATNSTPDLAHLYPGYEPTVLKSSAEVQAIFDQMPTGFHMPNRYFKFGGSQCYQRAELWSYDLYRNQNIKVMKTFVFYTFAYKNAYRNLTDNNFDWWFHVAPYVLNKDENGNVVESVLDPTFADTPLNMQDWSQLFVDTHVKCKEFVRYQDFKDEVVASPTSHVGTEHCYIVRVPGTDFNADSVEARDAGSISGYHFDMDQVMTSLENAPLNWEKDELKQKLGL